jgi:hypothetical protein
VGIDNGEGWLGLDSRLRGNDKEKENGIWELILVPKVGLEPTRGSPLNSF